MADWHWNTHQTQPKHGHGEVQECFFTAPVQQQMLVDDSAAHSSLSWKVVTPQMLPVPLGTVGTDGLNIVTTILLGWSWKVASHLVTDVLVKVGHLVHIWVSLSITQYSIVDTCKYHYHYQRNIFKHISLSIPTMDPWCVGKGHGAEQIGGPSDGRRRHVAGGRGFKIHQWIAGKLLEDGGVFQHDWLGGYGHVSSKTCCGYIPV